MKVQMNQSYLNENYTKLPLDKELQEVNFNKINNKIK